jgi:hypothetical protein
VQAQNKRVIYVCMLCSGAKTSRRAAEADHVRLRKKMCLGRTDCYEATAAGACMSNSAVCWLATPHKPLGSGTISYLCAQHGEAAAHGAVVLEQQHLQVVQ